VPNLEDARYVGNDLHIVRQSIESVGEEFSGLTFVFGLKTREQLTSPLLGRFSRLEHEASYRLGWSWTYPNVGLKTREHLIPPS
jgi:hypothetical protein